LLAKESFAVLTGHGGVAGNVKEHKQPYRDGKLDYEVDAICEVVFSISKSRRVKKRVTDHVRTKKSRLETEERGSGYAGGLNGATVNAKPTTIDASKAPNESGAQRVPRGANRGIVGVEC
jgi:glucan-binding YG repeat protein